MSGFVFYFFSAYLHRGYPSIKNVLCERLHTTNKIILVIGKPNDFYHYNNCRTTYIMRVENGLKVMLFWT